MKKTLAILLVLVLALGATALAGGEEENTITVDGDETAAVVVIPETADAPEQEVEEITIKDGGDLIYTGDVANDKGKIITTKGGSEENPNTLTMTGDIECVNIDGEYDKEPNSLGDAYMTSNLGEHTKIAVDGDVTSTNFHGLLLGASDIEMTVDGSVAVTTNEDWYNVWGAVVAEGSTLVISEDYTFDADQSAAITVVVPSQEKSKDKDKDKDEESTAAEVVPAVIVIDGTLSVDGEDTTVVDIIDSSCKTVDVAKLESCADIYVTTVELGEGVEWTGMDDTVYNAETNETYKDVVLAAINYIIHADEHINVSGGTESELKYFAGMTAEGEEIYNTTTLNTAKYNSQLRLEVADGYELDCSQFGADAKLVSLGNGVYTLYVTENGNLIFTATIMKAEATTVEAEATTTKKSKTLAERMMDREFGIIATDAEDTDIDFEATQADGVITVTPEGDTATTMIITRDLFEALQDNEISKVEFVANGFKATVKTENLEKVFEDETIDAVEITMDAHSGQTIASTVVGEEVTEIPAGLRIDVAMA